MAFTFFEPYINIEETFCLVECEKEEGHKTKSVDTMQKDIKNSYNNLPRPERKFCEDRVKRITENILERHLSNVSYEASKCGGLAVFLSAKIREEVKSLGLERYKIVCIVHIGQYIHSHGLLIGSRCLWLPLSDASVTTKIGRAHV